MLLKIWQISQKNHCVGAFFKYVTGLQACNFVKKRLFLCLRPATLSKKRLWHRCFPVTFVKFLKTPFFIEHLWWLLPTLLVPVTSDANLRIFQYKLLRNIGYFNSIFFKFGKVISSFCSIRMQGPETIIHLFHTCTETNILWYQLRLSL